MKILLVYLALVNAAAFVLMHTDKKKAIKGKWRIPEKTLLGVCAIGGSLGGLMGMRLFRHKTKHPQFYIGIPVMLVVHIALLVYLVPRL